MVEFNEKKRKEKKNLKISALFTNKIFKSEVLNLLYFSILVCL